MKTDKPPPKRSGNRMSEEEINAFLATKGNSIFTRRDPEELKVSGVRKWFEDEATAVRSVVDEALEALDDSERERREKKDAVSKNPPAIAEFICAITTKPQLRERVLGSRQECFCRDVDRFGRLRAVALYWLDTSRSFWPGTYGLVRLWIGGSLIQRWWRS